MKYKKLILVLSLFIIISIYLIHPYMESRNLHSFKDNIIRLHIRANSDGEEDQIIKNKIRDLLVKEFGESFGDSQSIEESRLIIKNNLEEIKSLADRALLAEGKNYSTSIDLGRRDFPTRKYGSTVFPAGQYESLIVTLGEGKGENWWCVMFPPLCFVDISHSNTTSVEKDLEKILTEEEVEILLSEKEPNVVFKSRIMEILEKTKVYFAQILNISAR